MRSVVINNDLKEILNYLSCLEEVEGVILNLGSEGEPILTVICYKELDNFIITNVPLVINKSSSYDFNRPTYYNDKLKSSEILFDKDFRLTKIKDSMTDNYIRRLTIYNG